MVFLLSLLHIIILQSRYGYYAQREKIKTQKEYVASLQGASQCSFPLVFMSCCDLLPHQIGLADPCNQQDVVETRMHDFYIIEDMEASITFLDG